MFLRNSNYSQRRGKCDQHASAHSQRNFMLFHSITPWALSAAQILLLFKIIFSFPRNSSLTDYSQFMQAF